MKARIFGAGSIGNHLAFALKDNQFEVEIVDIDKNALIRMKEMIYPSRYGKWDDSIDLREEPTNQKVDLEIIGTPPDTHAKILIERVKKNSSKLWMVEKPFLAPDMESCNFINDLIVQSGAKIFCGYNHSLSPAYKALSDFLVEDNDITLIDSFWLEHWGGIFKAHPWLDGPYSSYLGFSNRGGGAFMEHSHGIHLALGICNLGKDVRDFSYPEIISHNSFFDNSNSYDQSTQLVLKSKNGIIIRYTTDVLTKNTKKYIKVETSNSFYQLDFAINNGNYDALRIISNGKETIINYPRSRKLDFDHEIRMIKNSLIKNEFSDLKIIDWRLALYISKLGNQILKIKSKPL